MTDFHASTQELIHEIERKDRRFRAFQAVSITFVGLGIIALLGINYNIQRENHDLLDRQSALTMQLKQSVSVLEKNNDGRLADLQNHIDCIVNLFAQPNRANLVIDDITDCQLSSFGGAAGSTKSSVTNNATQTKPPISDNSAGNKAGSVVGSQPTPKQSPGFLQRNVLTPTMNLIKKLF